ncbi:hypothetical protein HLI_05945 [Halobacillus litoralis]|uniref:Uncharacterized protein n=1 Tax=Halobacillus litoralis TaxID=45668 RepID=A0A410MAR0_9BACI|nr:hypothetical protein HLI_05945 [Halobacillus litoralis]
MNESKSASVLNSLDKLKQSFEVAAFFQSKVLVHDLGMVKDNHKLIHNHIVNNFQRTRKTATPIGIAAL